MSTEKCACIEHAQRRGDEVHIDLWYPKADPANATALVIGLVDVRAADEIRVSYDFDRDGWKIEQASNFSWEADDEVCDRGWMEVAFVKAWGMEKQS